MDIQDDKRAVIKRDRLSAVLCYLEIAIG